MKYRIKVVETDTRYTTVEVEATNEFEAIQLAEDMACEDGAPGNPAAPLIWETGDFSRVSENVTDEQPVPEEDRP